jgi:DNA-binding XRE family transcriptional regulator
MGRRVPHGTRGTFRETTGSRSQATTNVGMHRAHRISLGISQSRLARLSGVSRFKICTYELGDGSLSPEQQTRIREALQAEAERLRRISVQMDFGQPQASPVEGASCG